nr:cob(I)yrinic acid a,c-diamide adenosyltransferase [Halorussus ruber]
MADSHAASTDPHIEPSTPEEFGLVQVWWGDGKGKTTAALGMGFRAAGHGYRVHLVQSKPDDLELVLTGGHQRPEYVTGLADLVTHVEKEAHPIEDGQGARKGTEY